MPDQKTRPVGPNTRRATYAGEQSSRAAEQQSSRAAEQQSSRLGSILTIILISLFQLSCTGPQQTAVNDSVQQPVVIQGSLGNTAPQPDEESGLTPGDIARQASSVIDEEDEWDIVSFTDPRDSSVYDIIDDRVIIAFKNPPELPEEDPGYFEDELASNDTYYTSVTCTSPSLNQDIADFIETEDLTVYAEWPEVNALAALLPTGQTVSDAVDNWPTEYSDIIDVVDPDQVGETQSFSYPPDDGYYANAWHTREKQFHGINIELAWDHSPPNGLGNDGIVVAIMDTGVQHGHADLTANSTAKGCNTGDNRSSTSFLSRSSGGGEPYGFLLERDVYHARNLGHGTCVAGIISAEINNDSGDDDETRAFGIASEPKYFPIAIKMKGHEGGAKPSMSSTLNAFTAIGCVLGVYDKSTLYNAQLAASTPHYYIRVANLSIGFEDGNEVAERHLDNLSRYILFVCSAGNDGQNSSLFPASYPRTMSIASYDPTGKRAVWSGTRSSNYGGMDIAAPGTAIRTTDMKGSTPINGYPLGYDSSKASIDGFLGTSSSAPIVSAIAALIYSENPYWFSSQTISRIISTRDELPSDTGPGSLQFVGQPDAYAALGFEE
ncbi:MAG: S8 family serine peptidase [bacterium]